MSLADLIGLLGGLLGGLAGAGGLISSLAILRRARAEIAQAEANARRSDVGALTETITTLQGENRRLRERLDQIEDRMIELEDENDKLREKLEER